MLEVIKHFFKTKGCVFLVATDTDALQHSVSAIYGTKFKSEDYLKRFFDRKIALSDVSVLDYLKCQDLDLAKYEEKGIIFSSFNGDIDKHISYFSDLFTSVEMKLRDIDQSLQKFFSSLNYIITTNDGIKIVINGVVLMAGIVEEVINIDGFKSRKPIGETRYSLSQINLVDLIQFHLSLVIKCYSKKVYAEDGRKMIHQTEQLVLGVQAEVGVSKNFNLNSNNNIPISLIVRYLDDESIKYWLWEDYRRIIEL